MRNSISLYCFFLILVSCGHHKSSTTSQDREQIIYAVIAFEKKDPFSLIEECKRDDKYLIYDTYQDTIHLDDSLTIKIDSRIRLSEIGNQYKKEFVKKLDFNTRRFKVIETIKDFSNRSPTSLFISRPIKYLDYYFIELNFNDWASGHGISYVLKKDTLAKFSVILSSVTWRY